MTKKGTLIIIAISFLMVFITISSASAFDWQKHSGTSIKLLLNKHPYTDALLAHLGEFTASTGIDVTYDVFPEDEYFDKVTISLSSKSPEYSVFMTGAYQVWQYAPPGFMEDLGPLTDFVLSESAAQLVRWKNKGLDLSACVNLASSQLTDSKLPSRCAELIDKYGRDCSKFTFCFMSFT